MESDAIPFLRNAARMESDAFLECRRLYALQPLPSDLLLDKAQLASLPTLSQSHSTALLLPEQVPLEPALLQQT